MYSGTGILYNIKNNYVTLPYSVKCVALNLSPFGAIKGRDAKFLNCQKLLRYVAVEDPFQSQCPRHWSIIYTQKF